MPFSATADTASAAARNRALIRQANAAKPKPGSQHTHSDLWKLERVLAALIDTSPADGEYARSMVRLYDTSKLAQHAHTRMTECYEDGMVNAAQRYALIAAAHLDSMREWHESLASVFAQLPESPVHPTVRHPANVTRRGHPAVVLALAS